MSQYAIRSRRLITLMIMIGLSSIATADEDQRVELPRILQWTASEPLVSIRADRLPPSADNPWFAVKDPSIVRDDGRWHLFCTLRKRHGGDGKPHGYIRVGYLSFVDWSDAADAQWQLLELSLDYHGAPQVFYFAPHRKWYLLYQLADPTRGIPMGPCISTTENLSDASSWSAPQPLYAAKPNNVQVWLDFWIICDQTKAHLFFTSLDGKMWRAETQLADFPQGFGQPEVALQGDIFEASHTYRLGKSSQYLTLVEAQGNFQGTGRRYFKGYLADRLEGPWREWQASAATPFAGPANVTFPASGWSNSVSHGELLRVGVDEHLEIDPHHFRLLIQGVRDSFWDAGYGGLPWQLGLLELRAAAQ